MLEVPPAARPTSSRAREALFDVLAERVVGARVLDLYAGSGAVALEAISRGAKRSVLVEARASAIERTLRRWGAGEPEVAVLRGDAADALGRLAARKETFDLVFCDPPYAAHPQADLGTRIAAVLAPGGTVVVQRDDRDPPPRAEPLVVQSRRAYGRNVFYFLAAAGSSGL
jgi:16S rRNA (guanine966-N2)-methyltransferase